MCAFEKKLPCCFHVLGFLNMFVNKEQTRGEASRAIGGSISFYFPPLFDFVSLPADTVPYI